MVMGIFFNTEEIARILARFILFFLVLTGAHHDLHHDPLVYTIIPRRKLVAIARDVVWPTEMQLRDIMKG